MFQGRRPDGAYRAMPADSQLSEGGAGVGSAFLVPAATRWLCLAAARPDANRWNVFYAPAPLPGLPGDRLSLGLASETLGGSSWGKNGGALNTWELVILLGTVSFPGCPLCKVNSPKFPPRMIALVCGWLCGPQEPRKFIQFLAELSAIA